MQEPLTRHTYLKTSQAWCDSSTTSMYIYLNVSMTLFLSCLSCVFIYLISDRQSTETKVFYFEIEMLISVVVFRLKIKSKIVIVIEKGVVDLKRSL